MITATGKMASDLKRSVIQEFEVEFVTINQLEHFIAYNRAHIISLEFTGTIDEED